LLELIVFVIASVALVVVFADCLRDPGSHGFYRFFAFEAILGLVMVNAEHWFSDPFSARQVISWLLLGSSLVLALHGFRLLRTLGKPDGPVESTTQVVRTGAYRYIRHPLYGSLLLGAWGAFLKDPSPVGALLGLLATGFLVATAKVEEGENLVKFGDEYASYMRETRMFSPFLF
jgi:protein-S-isoprenylcysteine O-methyltransferase Ste14